MDTLPAPQELSAEKPARREEEEQDGFCVAPFCLTACACMPIEPSPAKPAPQARQATRDSFLNWEADHAKEYGLEPPQRAGEEGQKPRRGEGGEGDACIDPCNVGGMLFSLTCVQQCAPVNPKQQQQQQQRQRSAGPTSADPPWLCVDDAATNGDYMAPDAQASPKEAEDNNSTGEARIPPATQEYNRRAEGKQGQGESEQGEKDQLGNFFSFIFWALGVKVDAVEG